MYAIRSYYVDVSELRAAEARLRFQKELLQLILDSIPAPIYFKDEHGVYLGCNQAFSAYIGRPVSEIVGRTVYEIAPPEKAKVYEAADRHLLEQGGIQIYEAKVRFADGSDRDVVFRITSYNVCYTKLLRSGAARKKAICANGGRTGSSTTNR